MARFCKFRGVKGVLVAHPLAPDHNPMRYAGQRRLPNAHEIEKHSERYEPIDEVLPMVDFSLEKAAQGKCGFILATCSAKNLAEAQALLAAVPAPATKPRKESE